MCHRYRTMGRCGHVVARWWEPRDPNRCREARDRARRRNKPVEPCPVNAGGRATSVRMDQDRICNAYDCWRDFILVNARWTCHTCHTTHPAGTLACYAMKVDDRGNPILDAQGQYTYCNHGPACKRRCTILRSERRRRR